MGKKNEDRFVGVDADGYEHPDPTPVEIPTRLRIPQRQVDRIREIIRRELSAAADADGWESFDEADDFEIEGEDPISAYEEVFEPGGEAPPAKQKEPQAAAGSAPAALDTEKVPADSRRDGTSGVAEAKA